MDGVTYKTDFERLSVNIPRAISITAAALASVFMLVLGDKILMFSGTTVDVTDGYKTAMLTGAQDCMIISLTFAGLGTLANIWHCKEWEKGRFAQETALTLLMPIIGIFLPLLPT